jgi:hypothetical protein
MRGSNCDTGSGANGSERSSLGGEATAANFINVATTFGEDDAKSLKFRDLDPSALYLLAAPSTPESVREKVAELRPPPTFAEVKKLVREAKAAETPPASGAVTKLPAAPTFVPKAPHHGQLIEAVMRSCPYVLIIPPALSLER